MAQGNSLSESTRRVLREADRRLRGIRRGDRPSVYRICRITMAALAPVDAFYVALIRDATTNVFPYTFDRGEYIDPDILPYRPGGLTHWIKASKRTYRWSDDAGALLSRGVPFGAAADLSRDALVAPLTGASDGEVVGMISVQSYTSGAFTDEHQLALEWLALSAMITIDRDEQDRERDRLYALYPELDTSHIMTLADLAGRVGGIRSELSQIASREDIAANGELLTQLHALIAVCEDLQIKAADAKEEGGESERQMPILTAREEEIARLIAQDMSNGVIASTLHLSEKTVKSHVTNILRKFKVSQRSAVAWQMRADHH